MVTANRWDGFGLGLLGAVPTVVSRVSTVQTESLGHTPGLLLLGDGTTGSGPLLAARIGGLGGLRRGVGTRETRVPIVVSVAESGSAGESGESGRLGGLGTGSGTLPVF